MDYKQAKDYILTRLERELPADLTYHCKEHTCDVLEAAERIAKAEGVDGESLILLQTATLYHDSGFLFGYKDHEKNSCDLAGKILPPMGYSHENLKEIYKLIQATKIPQNPHSLLAQILCDADLDYLGRDDFYVTGNTLYQEFLTYKIVEDEKGWNRLQVKFLESHHYFTKTAIALRAGEKEKHLNEVRKIVASY